MKQQATMKRVELKSITKHFGGTVANDDISFDLNEGEIHAVLGENGAGKSTLMNILSGLYYPDSGKIFIRGQEVRFRSPRDAIGVCIGMIHQHFMLVQSHTVLDNIILGTRLPVFLDRKKLADEVSNFCQRLNFRLNMNTRVWHLSMGEQQQVEIAKTLYRGASILILDEPTAILTLQESKGLFDILRSMKNEGHSIVFVSHKLDEVLSIADRISVLRKGKLVGTVHNENIQKAELARLMIGRDIVLDAVERRNVKDKAETVLSMMHVVARNDRRLTALNNVCLSLHSGEILGVAGVAGNGQSELAEVIAGLRKVESGTIQILGKDVTKSSVEEIIQQGTAYIPADRINVGTIGTLGITDNILLRWHSSFSFIDATEINSYSRDLVGKYNVVCSDLRTPVSHLSGGNLQKLILARELREIPKLLVAEYPTRGLDVRAIEYVRKVLINCRNKGSAILLISEDLDELLTMSDRIAVMYEGRLTSMPTRDVHKIGLAMAGSYEQ